MITQAQIEAAAKAIYKSESGDLDFWSTSGEWSILLARAALTAAAEVGEKDQIIANRKPPYNRGDEAYYDGYCHGKDDAVDDTIERCAQYHDKAADDCDKIAAVNMDNDLGPDCVTRAQDHRIDAAAIRAMKDQP